MKQKPERGFCLCLDLFVRGWKPEPWCWPCLWTLFLPAWLMERGRSACRERARWWWLCAAAVCWPQGPGPERCGSLWLEASSGCAPFCWRLWDFAKSVTACSNAGCANGAEGEKCGFVCGVFGVSYACMPTLPGPMPTAPAAYLPEKVFCWGLPCLWMGRPPGWEPAWGGMDPRLLFLFSLLATLILLGLGHFLGRRMGKRGEGEVGWCSGLLLLLLAFFRLLG